MSLVIFIAVLMAVLAFYLGKNWKTIWTPKYKRPDRPCLFHPGPSIKQRLEAVRAEEARKYEMLPDLGKARVDKEAAEVKKYGGTAGAAVVAAVACAINPVAWAIPLTLVGRWAYKNWKEQTNATEEADKRREDILR